MHPYQAMYEYLARAREHVLDWVGSLPPEQYLQEFPYGLQTIHGTLLHTASAEWAYGRRLRGESVMAADSPFTKEKMTAFAQVREAWTAVAEETRNVLAGITDWDAAVDYRMFPQGPGKPAVRIRTTRAGVAAQLILHEVHHRAQVMSMLRQLGVAAQGLDFAALMFDRTPEPA